MNKGIFVRAVNSVLFYLNLKEKRYAAFMIFLLFLSSILDVFGLAAFVPVIMAASKPNIIETDKYFSFLYINLGFTDKTRFLVSLIGILFFFFLLKNIFTTWINYKQIKFTASIGLGVVKRQLDRALNMPFGEFLNEGSANLINNVLYIPQSYISGIIRTLFLVFSELAIILVIVVGILVYQPILFLILVFVLVPATLFTYNFLKNRSEQAGNKTNSLKPVAQNILSNVYNGFVEIILSNKLDSFKTKFLNNQVKLQESEAKAYLFTLIPIKVIEMVAVLGIVTIFLYALLFPGYAGDMITLVGLFAAAAYRLMPSVNRLLTSVVTLKHFNYTMETLFSFSKYDANVIESSQQVITFKEKIQLQNLYFKFADASKPTINNVTLTVKKGEKVGLVGMSGSGKTTLINILLRFYTEQKGRIMVDNVPLTKENLKSWYDLIGYVKQDTFLMESSIKYNVTLEDNEEKIDFKKLERALINASLFDFVQSLPENIDTKIGEKGSKLSGGQRQRIGIARALYKDIQILILDEATSALDNATEREVSEAINKLAKSDLTIFIVAHRITTLKDCNKIFEMKNGEIIAQWSYEDLIKQVI